MLKKIIKLIRDFLQSEKDNALWRGLYANNYRPKTFGSKIRGH